VHGENCECPENQTPEKEISMNKSVGVINVKHCKHRKG